MRTIAVVDAGRASEAWYREYFRQAKRASGAEAVLVLTEGDAAREGGFAPLDKRLRAEKLLMAGAEAVLEVPLPGTLLVDNLFAFAAAAMLRKLGSPDYLAIPLAGMERFPAVAEFLFDEPPAYRRRMTELRDAGGDLEAALPGMVGEYVPGAEAFLRSPRNRMAVEYANTLRRTYSRVRPCLLELPQPEEEPGDGLADAWLLSRVREMFLSRPEREALGWAGEICGGSPRMAARLLDLLRKEEDDLPAFAARAACPDMNPAAVRRYLTCCLAGYRKVDSFVCITYNYIPYLKALGGTARGLAELRERAETTFILDAPGKAAPEVEDIYKRLLLDMDARVRAEWERAQMA